MDIINTTTLVRAVRMLFGNQVDVNRDFLTYVQPSGVKSAYRRKAKENHPDLFVTQPAHVQERQTAELRRIIEAYDVLNRFFTQREDGRWNPVRATQQSRVRKPETVRKNTGRSTARTNGHRTGDRSYTRGVPPRTLLFGKYLFYRGKITFGSLIEALLWQRRQRPSASAVALQWGLLDQAAVATISRLCRDPRKFGDKAIALGLLTTDQVQAIMEYKRSLGFRLGEYFVREKIFSREELDTFVREHNEHNAAVLAVASRKPSWLHGTDSSGSAKDQEHL